MLNVIMVNAVMLSVAAAFISVTEAVEDIQAGGRAVGVPAGWVRQ